VRCAMSDLLSLRDVSMGYARGKRRVLVDVSLGLGSGAVGAVVASRYEGKTTLLKIAAGMLSPDRGEVLVGDTNLTRCSGREREELWGRQILRIDRAGPALDYRVRDYIALPLMGHGCRPREMRSLAGEALGRLGIASCWGQRWKDLSNWEQLLVEFARAFVARPRLLVVDDLLDGFGMRRTREASELLRMVADDLKCAVLMSTADFETALVADRIWMLGNGRLEAMSDLTGPDAEVIDFPGAGRGRGARGVGS